MSILIKIPDSLNNEIEIHNIIKIIITLLLAPFKLLALKDLTPNMDNVLEVDQLRNADTLDLLQSILNTLLSQGG
jgi:hypothetical protein